MEAAPVGQRLLIVEHDPGLSDLLQVVLTEAGCAVICASSLPQALVLAEEQVFNGIFTTLFPQQQQHPLRSIEPLRALTQPTPIVVLSRCFVEEADARRHGYAAVLELPFRIEDILQVLARYINCPFSPEQARRADLITRYLDALGRGEWDVVRSLCLPTVQYISLTSSLFRGATTLVGIEDYLAYAQEARQQLPDYRIEHRVVFVRRGQFVTRYVCSWQGRDGQRLSLAGSFVCHFAGERIAHIGVALNRRRLGALLADTASG